MPLQTKREYTNAFTEPHGSSTPLFSFGTVYGVNPAAGTVDAYIDGNGYQGLPVLGEGGGELNRDTSVIHNLLYATVMMVKVGASYYVLGPVPRLNNIRNSDPTKDVMNLNETIPVGEPAEYTGAEFGSKRLNDYKMGRPVDYLPGDKILSLNNGTLLGLFREGIAKLKASQLCQFILYKYQNLARLVASTFEFFSDFGEITIGHDKSDKVGLHLKGGASFTNETHPGVGMWTIQAWLGANTEDPEYLLKSEPDDFIQQAVPENVRLHIRVNDPSNANVATFTMDTDGHIILNMSGDNRELVTQNKRTQINQDEYKDILGNKTTDVMGDEELSVQGDKSTVVGGDKSIAVVGQLGVSANEGMSFGSGRTITIQSDTELKLIAPKISVGSS